MKRAILDRYLLGEWVRIFLFTGLGFPIVVIALELTDRLDEYLSRGLEQKAVALSFLFGLPEKVFLILPAAVLFATVFSIGAMGRHSELTAAKASGRSFHRMVFPILGVSLVAAALGLALGELAPITTRKQLELLREKEVRSTTARYNFVFRADEGWVYVIRSLDANDRAMRDVVLEREGAGLEYPTLVIQARVGRFDDSTARWTLAGGRFRLLPGDGEGMIAFAFDSMRQRSLIETPSALMAEPKAPEELRYIELKSYIEALERSGGDARKLRVDLALKIAIPVTCIIIAIFGAPLAITSPRESGTVGVAISLGTTVLFLLFVQLSKAIGAGGVLPPTVAAWTPNIIFGVIGLWLMKRAPT